MSPAGSPPRGQAGGVERASSSDPRASTSPVASFLWRGGCCARLAGGQSACLVRGWPGAGPGVWQGRGGDPHPAPTSAGRLGGQMSCWSRKRPRNSRAPCAHVLQWLCKRLRAWVHVRLSCWLTFCVCRRSLHRGSLELQTLGRAVCCLCVNRPAKAFVLVPEKGLDRCRLAELCRKM